MSYDSGAFESLSKVPTIWLLYTSLYSSSQYISIFMIVLVVFMSFPFVELPSFITFCNHRLKHKWAEHTLVLDKKWISIKLKIIAFKWFVCAERLCCVGCWDMAWGVRHPCSQRFQCSKFCVQSILGKQRWSTTVPAKVEAKKTPSMIRKPGEYTENGIMLFAWANTI